MSKVYIVNKIHNSYGNRNVKIFGVFSKEENADKLCSIENKNRTINDDDVEVDEFELDDPELLNRIAKEGK